MGREFELKYKATAEAQAAICSAFTGFRRIAMETTYFDTPDGALAARAMTLRLRKENDHTICTLKTPMPDGSRGEWECQAQQIEDGLAQLMAMGAPREASQLAEAGLIAVCGARFTRMAAQVPTADGFAELAVDTGILLGGERQIPLQEVEVELKSGSDAAICAFAKALAQQFALLPEKKSKFRRALALAQEE